MAGIAVPAYYTLQLTRPADGWRQLQAFTAGARSASEQMRREGVRVRFLRSIFVPEDETCFYLFQADTRDAVREAARRAGLPTERFADAISEAKGAAR